MQLSSKLFQALTILVILSLHSLNSCTPKKKNIPEEDIGKYITAYSSGVISSTSAIRVRLADAPEGFRENEVLDKGLLVTNPALKGITYFRKYNTVEFVPEDPLGSGESYEILFDLGKLIPGSAGRSEIFSFQVRVMEQDFSIHYSGLELIDGDAGHYTLGGELTTADAADINEIEGTGRAWLGNEPLNFRWQRAVGERVYSFRIDSIARIDNEQKLQIKWDGAPLGVDRQLHDTILIPSRNKFQVTSVRTIQGQEQRITVSFSDPLDRNQVPDGLITLSSADNLNISVDGNIVTLFPPEHLAGPGKLEIFSGIRNASGKTLDKKYEYNLFFEDIKPAVKLIGKGVVLPSSRGLVLNIEAVNLNAVDLSVIKVYEDNIPAFLQENRIDGSYSLTRVGIPILKKRIDLIPSEEMATGTWKAYSVDLTGMFEKDPGAIYRAVLSFRKEYSAYACNGDDDDRTGRMTESYDLEDEFGKWDSPDSYYSTYYYPEGFRWSERDNPCHVSYYTEDRWDQTNLLASDIGIIAKGGSANEMFFAVTNLLTTDPIPGATLEVFDFQLQSLEKLTTDNEGFARISLGRKPFLLVAAYGDQKNYLRLDDGTSLSMSQFDVDGQLIQEGLKGFIYGERGVWRPGDSLFLNFILYDEGGALPAGHPVIMQLVNPQGQVVDRMVRRESSLGIYNFATATENDAPTGNWEARVQAGGAVFSRRVRIETVKPNRLKIDLTLSDDTIFAGRGPIKAAISARWLHGAPAKDLKARTELTLKRGPAGYFHYPGYIFTDPTRDFSYSTTTIFDNALDSKGEGFINADIGSVEGAPGMLTATFYNRVFESGGDFSYDYLSVPFAPFRTFIGIKTPAGDQWGRLLTDSTHIVDIITVDAQGKPVQARNLRVSVYKVEWRWWWNASDDDLASYYGDQFHEMVLDESVSTGKDGRAVVSFSITYPDWGRYLVYVSDPVGGHAAGKSVYVDWPGFAGREGAGRADGASMLSFTTDKEEYNVGEPVSVTFPSASGGRALVSIEDGSGILEASWVHPEDGQTTYVFKATESMTPNVYVNVTLIQPHAQTANDLPIRLYGVRPVLVSDPTTKLNPVIETTKEFKPGERVLVKVSEEAGREMGFTLAIVDEGLLDITRYKTPDPRSVFFAREALGVRTWDLYDFVIGAYSGELTRLLAIGGGDEADEAAGRKVNRFEPVVKFFGPYNLGRGDVKEVTFTMPEYVGSVRLMAVASGEDAFGSTEMAVPVRKPLMVLATLPRVLGPGETVKLPVNVFTMERGIGNVKVTIEPGGLLKSSGRSSAELYFTEPGEQLTEFVVRVDEAVGTGKVKVIAESGKEAAYQEIEMEVRNPNPPVENTIRKILEPGEATTFALEMPGMDGTNQAMLEVSRQPYIDFGRRLRYLTGYPHGCAEQIVSGAFPQLYLEKVVEYGGDLASTTEKNVRAAINKVYSLQMNNGGIRYWPGQTTAADWITSYAGHFMLEARDKGFTLPPGFLDNWTGYQAKAANQWRPGVEDFRGYQEQSSLEQAYRLYTLALAGKPQLSAMNRLKETPSLGLQAKWRLAAAYALAGQPEVAGNLVQNLGTDAEEYRKVTATYGSGLRDQAMILETLTLLRENEKAQQLAFLIAERLGSDEWFSTQTTAYCLLAIAKFLGENVPDRGDYGFEIIDGLADVGQITTSAPYYQRPLEPVNRNLAIKNINDHRIYLTITLSGTPIRDSGLEIADNIGIEVKYYDMDENPIDVTTLEQGTDLIAEVTVTNPGIMGMLSDLVLTQVFPSGWEIINTRLIGTELIRRGSAPDYQDIRDDRVYTYFGIGPGNVQKYRMLLNAAYLGTFYLPPVSCEAMYDNNVQARKAGGWIEIVKPGSLGQ